MRQTIEQSVQAYAAELLRSAAVRIMASDRAILACIQSKNRPVGWMLEEHKGDIHTIVDETLKRIAGEVEGMKFE